MNKVQSLAFQVRKLSPIERQEFNCIIRNGSSLAAISGKEGEDLISRIPNIRKAKKGNGVDFISRKNVQLEVKFSKPSLINGVEHWCWNHVEANRSYQRLILIGKYGKAYTFYDFSKEESKRVTYSQTQIHVSCNPVYSTARLRFFKEHQTSLDDLCKRYG